MSHDLVIRGGVIVDGTGNEPFEGDIAIDGSSITAIGMVEEGESKKFTRAETPSPRDSSTYIPISMRKSGGTRT